MHGFIGIVIMIALACSLGGCNLGWADVFKTEAADAASFNNALANDVHARYYRQGEDYPINSQLSSNNHDVDGGEVGGGFPDGYGGINVGSHLDKDLVKSGVPSSRADQIAPKAGWVELKKLEYTDPVEADLLKHFHVAEILKEGVRVQQYVELQKVVDDPIYKLAARSQLRCINKALKGTPSRGGVSLGEAFDRCLKEPAFEMTSAPDGMLFKALGLDAYSNGIKRDVVRIAGDVELKRNDYEFIAPKEYIGNVLAKSRSFYKQKIDELLDQYLGRNDAGGERYVVDEEMLKSLSLPGFTVQAYQIRNLSVLQPEEADIAANHLASRLAYIKTVQRYAQADECLRRAIENPKVEAAYKSFIQDRRQFLKEELASLALQRSLTEDYADTMSTIIDQADKERLGVIKQMVK